MYFVKYGNEYLHDPRNDGYTLVDLSLSCEENSCGYCDFTIYPDHPMYDKLKERDSVNQIEVYDDDILLFAGFIYELGKEFYLDGHVKCKGEMEYLNQSIVRPYSTYERGFGTEVGNTLAEVFAWLIEQHNNQTDKSKWFTVGKNEAAKLYSDAVDMYNDDRPATIEEISDLFIGEEGLGGYLRIRHVEGIRYIDLLAEWTDKNTQLLEFGVNLTDFTMTDDSEEVYTFVVPTGAKIKETEYEYDDGYFETTDTTPVEGKTYYTKTLDYIECEDLNEFKSGVTYYEYYDGYYITSDDEPQSGTTYYTKSEYYSDEYDEYEGSIFYEGVNYYERNSEYPAGYYETSDSYPHPGTTYYTYDWTGEYTKEKDTLIKFKPDVDYYEYDEQRDESDQAIDISDVDDGVYHTDDFVKIEDYIYSRTAVEKYGLIGYPYSNTELTSKEDLVTYGIYDLMKFISPQRTIEVKAVDMHLVDGSIKPIRIGEHVRVRSRPHDLDSYFLCKSIELDLNNPENSIYTLSTTYDKVSGESNRVINALNATLRKDKDRDEPIAPV